jgi:hypothetical protein
MKARAVAQNSERENRPHQLLHNMGNSSTRKNKPTVDDIPLEQRALNLGLLKILPAGMFSYF